MASDTITVTMRRRDSFTGWAWFQAGTVLALLATLLRSHRVMDWAARAVIRGMAITFPALLFLAGCGASWQTTARTAIEASAVLVDTGDSALAVAIKSDCAPLVEHMEPGSPERVHVADLCLNSHHYDDAIHAVAVADHSLRAAQAVVDGAERAHDAHLWTAAAPCLAVAVGDVVAALTAAGVTLPPAVMSAVTMLEAFAGTCPAPPGGT